MGAALLVTGIAVTVPLATAPVADALTNGLAATPQMGWNDWNAFGCSVSAGLVEQTADAMVANGMAKAGYRYVNIDDCWLERQRDANGNLVPDPAKFPQGIKAVADYVHAKGLKLGIYEDAGTATCAGYPGSLGHEQQDAATFASWGIDYLKYDNCNNAGSTTTQQYIDRYTAMRDALAATGRPILYSLCEWGVNQPWTWGPQVGNSWRTTGDINDSYNSMLSIFQQNVWLYPYSGPGAWNDPDMLEIGNGGMTTAEYRTEFSLWAAMDAPLLAGTDLRTISPADLAVYTNQQVIAVDQDRLGKQAVPIAAGGEPAGDNGLWVLSKPLAGGDRAVVLFNSTGSPATIRTTATEVGMPKARDYQLNDLWAHTDTETAGAITAQVPAHGVVMYRVSTSVGNVAPSVALSASDITGATPGTPTTMTASLTNNGRTRVKRATVSVTVPSGWSVKNNGAATFHDLGTGSTVTATFTVTPPQPTEPIRTDQVTATATYTWRNRHSEVSAGQQVQLVSPVQTPYRTFSSATDAPARFGQVGDDFAISGAGTDLWTNNDNYSTIYRPGVVGTSSTVQTEVTSASGLAGYAKAGILVRNDITTAGSGTEGVILYVSPSGGIQLEWNSDGNTNVDSVTPSNGTIPIKVPVTLRLVRSGSGYTGYYSTDGQNWTTVGTATVPGQADTQDAGLFVVSASTGSPALVGYHGLTIN
ncbi:MAG TPA: NEW3 domain-containing protein [Pseudonocardiaceae bacterium]|nr:NEW3 domain-containing protein [Pseudonocardiaceae bacterium]